jgi:hypothetical protein
VASWIKQASELRGDPLSSCVPSVVVSLNLTRATANSREDGFNA